MRRLDHRGSTRRHAVYAFELRAAAQQPRRLAAPGATKTGRRIRAYIGALPRRPAQWGERERAGLYAQRRPRQIIPCPIRYRGVQSSAAEIKTRVVLADAGPRQTRGGSVSGPVCCAIHWVAALFRPPHPRHLRVSRYSGSVACVVQFRFTPPPTHVLRHTQQKWWRTGAPPSQWGASNIIS